MNRWRGICNCGMHFLTNLNFTNKFVCIYIHIYIQIYTWCTQLNIIIWISYSPITCGNFCKWVFKMYCVLQIICLDILLNGEVLLKYSVKNRKLFHNLRWRMIFFVYFYSLYIILIDTPKIFKRIMNRKFNV